MEMEKYVWLFPIIFIIHDMEEIIGLGIWLRKNKELLDEKYSFITKTYKNFSTEGFSLAVFEELLICVLISLLALLTNNEIMWYIWFGGFIGCTIHFVVHIGQSVILRQYIPALATSIIFLPISIYIIYKSYFAIQGSVNSMIIGCIVGIVSVFVNLVLIQKVIGWFTIKMNLPSFI
uniref:HXXEE domain-containing protein n=1 Tax=Piromyces sp. TaxID=45796 RepID=A0A2S1TYS7_PIRSP|nr:hypothetical protein [Piromyces sp.]